MLTSNLWSQYHTLMWIFLLLTLHARLALSYNEALQRDGEGHLSGMPGLVYEALNYEPLCGHITQNAVFEQNLHCGFYCTVALELFSDDTVNNYALYSQAGEQLTNKVVGNGTDVCMCFALSQTGDNPQNWAACVFANGNGYAYVWDCDYIYRGNYKFGVSKALPQCWEKPWSELTDSWSATEGQVPSTDTADTSSTSSTLTTTETTDEGPPITPAPASPVATITTTNSEGDPTSMTVYVAAATVAADNESGLNKDQEIALGVGLGIGIPTVLLAALAIWYGDKTKQLMKDLLEKLSHIGETRPGGRPTTSEINQGTVAA